MAQRCRYTVDQMVSFTDLLKRRAEIAVLAVGVVSMLLIPIPSGFFFSPPFSVYSAYLMLMLVSLIRRPQDRRLSLVASSALAVVGLYWSYRAYFHWNSLGIILNHEMPIATLAISIPSTILLLLRKADFGRKS
jgi:hypothetical protein